MANFDLRVDLFIDGWVDVSSDVQYANKISITRGQQNEATRSSPTLCNLTLLNNSNDYSTQNPNSVNYGKLGVNTPLRVARKLGNDTFTRTVVDGWGNLTSGQAWVISGTASDFDVNGSAGTIDGTATGYATFGSFKNADVLCKMKTDVLEREMGLVARFQNNLNFYSFELDFDSGSQSVDIFRVVSGSFIKIAEAAFTFLANTNYWMRVQCQGESLRARVWKDGDPEPFTWTVAVNDTGPPLSGAIGVSHFGTTTTGTYDNFEALDIRHLGSAATWKPTRDDSGKFRTMGIESGGVLRRLGQGKVPIKSALYREYTSPNRTTPVAYWPCEDGKESRSVSPGNGHKAMAIKGTPEFEFFSDFLASAPLPRMGTARFIGPVPAGYTNTDTNIVRAFVHQPSAITGTKQILSFRAAGTASLWIVWLDSGGDLTLKVYNAENELKHTSAVGDFNINGEKCELKLETVRNGTAQDYKVGVRKIHPDGTSTATEIQGTVTAAQLGVAFATVGHVLHISIAYDQNLPDLVVGHIVFSNTTATFTNIQRALEAWSGEPAGERIERLCSEEGITFEHVGTLAKTELMGAQQLAKIIELFNQAAEVDGGLLYDTRYDRAITYRTRLSLSNRSSKLTLDVTAGELAPSFQPEEGDQYIRNAVRVTRTDGGSTRVVKETGPLNISEPEDDPEGVGFRDEEVTLNLYRDDDTGNQAGWRVHKGTWPGYYYPRISAQLGNHLGLLADATALDLGDKLTIDKVPTDLQPDDIEVLVIGYNETIDQYLWGFVFNALQAGPYDAVTDTSGGNFVNTSGSELTANITSSATTFNVTTTTGEEWRLNAGPFDINVGGERITLSNVDDTASPQQFTVIRSVNGVVKAHTAGTKVQLWEPMVVAL